MPARKRVRVDFPLHHKSGYLPYLLVQHSFGEKSAADLSPRHGLGLALFFAYRPVAFFGAPFRINLLYSFDLTG